MLFATVVSSLLDSSLGEVFNSPFVVPVAGCAMIASIVVAGIWSGVRTREIRSHERLARIAQGLPVEPDWDEHTLHQARTTSAAQPSARPNNGSGARRAGLVLLSIGIGLIVFFAFLAMVVRVREVLSGAAAGILPLAIGIGFMIDANLRRRDYDLWLDTVRDAVSPVDATGFRPEHAAQNPPSTLTPAQASDWRPLH